MTEQEWLDSLAARLPERNLEWVMDLAGICSTEWTGDKPPTGETSPPSAAAGALHDSDASTPIGSSPHPPA
ncbi:hypothetical protein [Streptomyces sp. 2P-4]|uniref:hypothetical protein n=1 Tax=Streptomyces sp. 2P-4 TaxID=2931974 RepID=UPI0025414568|nr:hypothetical protein [Streptomyces sp. 2P-4]